MTNDEQRRWVVLDLGETLIGETAVWARWADYLDVPHLTFFGALGAVIEQRRPHTDVFEYFRRDFRLEKEFELRAAAGLSWEISEADLYPDVLDSLAQLRLQGFALAVMANQPRDVEEFLATLPVDRVATSAAWGVEKPDPAFFARVASELGVAPEHIAYVGDRVDNDVLPSRAAGMFAVHLRRGPWGVIQSEWPEASEADLRITSLAALGDALSACGWTAFPPSADL
jgi:HAD superfamily hydrolase (TIGR01549 family)